MFDRKTGFAGRIDGALLTPPVVAAPLAFVGFGILVVSALIGIASFRYPLATDAGIVAKQVGFAWAINWSVSFILLVPGIAFFGLMSYRGLRTGLDELARRGMILRPDGRTADADDLFDALRGILICVSVFVAAMIAMAVRYSYWEYSEVVGQHFANGFYPDIRLLDPMQERDWSVAALLPAADGQNTVSRVWNDRFSLVVYLLLPGLWTGLAFGYYVFLVGFIWYLYKLSDRFVFLPDLSDKDKRRGFQAFSDFVENGVWLTLVVYTMCYLMILQNVFLRDREATIFSFVAPEFRKGMEAFKSGKYESALDDVLGLITEHPGVFNLQGELGIGIGILVAVIVLGFVVVTLRYVAAQSQKRALDLIGAGGPLPESWPALSEDEYRARAKDIDFWPAAWPTVNNLLVWVLGSVLCLVFYKVGLYFTGIALAYLLSKMLGLFGLRKKEG